MTTRWPSASTVSVRSRSSSCRRSSSWGRKHIATPYSPAGGRLGADQAAQQLVGELEQHARAVAGVRVGARRAAVLEVLEGGDRPLDRLVAGVAAQPRDERDAAGIVLVRRVVEADRLGRPRAWRQRTAPKGRGVGTWSRKGSSERAPRGPRGRRFAACWTNRGLSGPTQRSCVRRAARHEARRARVAAMAPAREVTVLAAGGTSGMAAGGERSGDGPPAEADRHGRATAAPSPRSTPTRWSPRCPRSPAWPACARARSARGRAST